MGIEGSRQYILNLLKSFGIATSTPITPEMAELLKQCDLSKLGELCAQRALDLPEAGCDTGDLPLYAFTPDLASDPAELPPGQNQ